VLLSQLWSLIFSLGALVALWWAWRVLEMAWISPRRLARALQAQGLHGTAYRFPFGDLREFARLVGVARSKPMPLSHGITPRVAPLYHNVIKEHGTSLQDDFTRGLVSTDIPLDHCSEPL
jgi:cytochrome P450 family 3 subfamily A